MNDLDLVVLDLPQPEYGLEAGDVGTIVHVYADGEAYEVEFATAEGVTVAILTLPKTAIRPMAAREILRVRELDSAA